MVNSRGKEWDGFGINFHTVDNFFNDLYAAVNRRYPFPLKCFQPSGGVMVAFLDNDRGGRWFKSSPLGYFSFISQLTQVLLKSISLYRLNYSYPLGGVNGSMPRQ